MTKNDVVNIKNKFESYYLETKYNKSKIVRKFRREYRLLERNRKRYNEKFLIREKEKVKELLDNICGYSLDNEQREIVVKDDQNTLVIAGAGSGKSLTIIGKIRYLIERKSVPQNKILCISFTNEATISLKNKLKKYYNYDIKVTTFHKLGLDIIKKNQSDIRIADSNTLDYLIEEYFNKKELIPFICIYFEIKENDYEKYISNHSYALKSLKELVATFIHLYKANFSSLEYYKKIFKSKIKWSKRDYMLLKIIYSIHKLYEEELQASLEIDFDDMLHLATYYVKNNDFPYSYQYIIIDEYQDTSYSRFLLINSILEKTKAHLLAVGDDFQSIYRFTGCDLNIFLNFKKYFNDATILKIKNTYRNPIELIQIAGHFIMKNKKQMKKKLMSHIHLTNPIQIAYYNNKKEIFKKLISKIYNETKAEIMILGRNNRDIETVIDNDFHLEKDKLIYLKNKDILMKYYTVHRSKGLECDNVIIINMEDRVLGFPSQLNENKILKYVLNQKDYYPFEEERRLFYVALTRTKNRVYLLVPNMRQSIFLKELQNDFNIEIIKNWN